MLDIIQNCGLINKMANLNQNGKFKSKWRTLNKMADKEYVPGAVEV